MLVEDGALVRRASCSPSSPTPSSSSHARPPGRGRAADQHDAQPGARAPQTRAAPTSAPPSGRDRPRQGAAAIRDAASRSPRTASSPARPSPTAATTSTTSTRRLRDPRPASPDENAPVEPARPAARLHRFAQQSLDIARASLDALNLRAPVDRPAHRLRHPGRPIAEPRRAARPDRQRRPQQAAAPTSTNSISAASPPGQIATRRLWRQDLPAEGRENLSAGAQRHVRRSTCCSSAPSRRSSSAARPCRPS